MPQMELSTANYLLLVHACNLSSFFFFLSFLSSVVVVSFKHDLSSLISPLDNDWSAARGGFVAEKFMWSV